MLISKAFLALVGCCFSSSSLLAAIKTSTREENPTEDRQIFSKFYLERFLKSAECEENAANRATLSLEILNPKDKNKGLLNNEGKALIKYYFNSLKDCRDVAEDLLATKEKRHSKAQDVVIIRFNRNSRDFIKIEHGPYIQEENTTEHSN